MSEKSSTKVERVVVWEGEWAPVRRFFHNVLVLKDSIVNCTIQTAKTTATKVDETKTSVIKTADCKFL